MGVRVALSIYQPSWYPQRHWEVEDDTVHPAPHSKQDLTERTDSMLQLFILTSAALLAGCTTVTSTQAEPLQATTVVSHEPTDGVIFNILAAEMSAHQGDHHAAFSYYQRAAEQSDEAMIAERGAKLSIHSQDVGQTITATQRWVALEPESVEANRILAALYLRSGQRELSLSQFKQLLSLKEGKLEGYQLIAEQLRKEPDSAAADWVMQQLVEANRAQSTPHYIQGWYYSRKQQFETALQAVDRALAIESSWGKAITLRASVLESMGRSDELQRFLKQQAADHPGDIDVLSRYGQVLLKQDRIAEAVLQFEQALEIEPRSSHLLSTLGLIHISEKRYRKARPYLDQLLELPGQRDKANFYMGELEEGEGDPDAAMSHYASVGKGGLYLNARVKMAQLTAKTSVDEGLSILRGLSFHDPRKKLQVLLIEAVMLEDAERYPEAIKTYDQALKLSPENEEVLYSRAMAADLAGDLAALERDLQAIVKKNPQHYHAWNALGYTLTLRTERYEEAKGYLEKALALRPKDFYVLDSMGWVLYKMKEMEQSIDYLQRAFDANPDAEVAAHLGEVRWASGDYEGAKKIWRKGQSLDHDNKVLLETLRRFNQ